MAILALLLAVGCSGEPRVVPVEGQVFIVTKGRENIKLGLTTISAYPESIIVKQVDFGRKVEARAESLSPMILDKAMPKVER